MVSRYCTTPLRCRLWKDDGLDVGCVEYGNCYVLLLLSVVFLLAGG